MRTLAIIPARGGSKGVFRKNARTVGGVPLVCRSIRHAYAAANVEDVYVSTEDAIVQQMSVMEGATVVPRPGEFATDTATLPDVMRHAVEHIGLTGGDEVVMLMPTYPFREAGFIDQVINFRRHHDAPSAMCGIPPGSHPYLCFHAGPRNTGIPFSDPVVYRRQERPEAFAICLFVTVFAVRALDSLDDGFWTDDSVFYPLDHRPLDIDTEYDLSIANEVCEHEPSVR